MSQTPFEEAMGKGQCPACGRLVQRKRDFTLRKHAGCDHVDDSDAFHYALLDAALVLSPGDTAACDCGDPDCMRVFTARDRRT